MRLLYYANGARYKANGEWVFRKWVEVPSKQLLQETGIHRSTMYKLRDELAKAGYIRFKTGDGRKGSEYYLCQLSAAQKAEPKSTQEYRSQPKPTNQEAPKQGSFDTDDFFARAVAKTFGDDL